MADEITQVVDFQDRFLFSLSQLSNAFGPARETIGKRLQDGGVAPAGKRKGHAVYHIGPAARAILDGEQPAFDGIIDPDKLPPKERLDWYRSENEKTKLQENRGGLLPRSEHERTIAWVVKTLLQSVETLPDLLERRCRLAPDAVEEVERAVDEAREELARKLENFDVC